MDKLYARGSVLLGILFLIIAAYYWMTPAGNLPHFMPGYVANGTVAHFKHGLASLILAFGLFIFAWFKSAPASLAH